MADVLNMGCENLMMSSMYAYTKAERQGLTLISIKA